MDPILTADDMDELREIEEAQMLDTLDFRRVTGRSEPDPESWRETPTTEPLFTTPGTVVGVSGGDAQVRTITVGGVERTVIRSGIKIPTSAPPLPAGAVVEVMATAIGPHTDPGVLNKVYRVVGYGGTSWATARRFDVVEM